MDHTFVSRLSLDECVQAFTAGVTPDQRPLPDPSKPFLGTLEGQRFRLRTLPARRNSWAPVFSGTFRAGAAGTLIQGRFGVSSFARIFMVVWFAFLAIMLLAIACALFSALGPALPGGGGVPVQAQGNASPEALRGLVLLLVLGLAGVGVMAYGKLRARGEKESILQFVQGTLDAQGHEADGGG